MQKTEIRKAKVGDENTLAYIQAESWKRAFAEILSKEDLEKYTDTDRIRSMYDNVLKSGITHGLVMSVGGEPHCIAFWSKSREEKMPEYAELICIHSLSENWGKGYGTVMMNHIFSDVKNAGFDKIMLWVFEKNERARKFYEKCGFKLTESKKIFCDAVEVMYIKEFIS